MDTLVLGIVYEIIFKGKLVVFSLFQDVTKALMQVNVEI